LLCDEERANPLARTLYDMWDIFMKHSLFSLVIALCPLAAGCAMGVQDEGFEAVDSTEYAATACGANYGEAFEYYKRAVDDSKDRLRYGVCQSENGFMWAIADNASRAVMTCGAFRDVIRTSPWAAPLRQALAPSLTLRSLTGELLVIKDSPWQNWSHVEEFFEQGVSFWARSQGAYGYSVKVDFGANGSAVWGEQTYDESTGEISWRVVSATYAITKTSSQASGRRLVTVTHDGIVEKFSLGVIDAEAWKDAPLFVLDPLGTGPEPGQGATVPQLFSLVTECDA